MFFAIGKDQCHMSPLIMASAPAAKRALIRSPSGRSLCSQRPVRTPRIVGADRGEGREEPFGVPRVRADPQVIGADDRAVEPGGDRAVGDAEHEGAEPVAGDGEEGHREPVAVEERDEDRDLLLDASCGA